MTRIVCEECKKTYDYDKDDFCPRCGAYNPPRKVSGATVRVDGMNESGHAGSFAHREVHAEKARRRAVGLDQPKPVQRTPTVQSRPAAPRPQTSSQSGGNGKKSSGTIIAVIVWIIILFQFLRLFFEFF